MTDVTPVAKKEEWIAPEIRTLDVGETNRFNLRGNDAGAYGDASRS